jgi:hypothetical protein
MIRLQKIYLTAERLGRGTEAAFVATEKFSPDRLRFSANGWGGVISSSRRLLD